MSTHRCCCGNGGGGDPDDPRPPSECCDCPPTWGTKCYFAADAEGNTMPAFVTISMNMSGHAIITGAEEYVGSGSCTASGAIAFDEICVFGYSTTVDRFYKPNKFSWGACQWEMKLNGDHYFGMPIPNHEVNAGAVISSICQNCDVCISSNAREVWHNHYVATDPNFFGLMANGMDGSFTEPGDLGNYGRVVFGGSPFFTTSGQFDIIDYSNCGGPIGMTVTAHATNPQYGFDDVDLTGTMTVLVQSMVPCDDLTLLAARRDPRNIREMTSDLARVLSGGRRFA